jgi:hypothetical protein
MWIVAFQLEVFVFEVKDALDVRIDYHPGQRARLTCQLEFGLL